MWGLLQTISRSPLTAGTFAIPERGFKVVSALRKRCVHCRFVKRGKKVYTLCIENPRHKQRQGKGGAIYRQKR